MEIHPVRIGQYLVFLYVAAYHVYLGDTAY